MLANTSLQLGRDLLLGKVLGPLQLAGDLLQLLHDPGLELLGVQLGLRVHRAVGVHLGDEGLGAGLLQQLGDGLPLLLPGCDLLGGQGVLEGEILADFRGWDLRH